MIETKDLYQGVIASTIYYFILTVFTGHVSQYAPFWFFGGYLFGAALINLVKYSTGRGYETAELYPKAKHKKIWFIWIYRVETLKGKKLWIISNHRITPKVTHLKRVTNHIFTRFI